MTGEPPRRDVGVEAGYDLWAAQYDATANPLVALDDRYTMTVLAPQPGERVLDVGCGTGRHFARLLAAGADPVGMDVSGGMLGQARRRFPTVPVHRADVQVRIPLADDAFDAVLCALVGEHLDDPAAAFAEIARVLRPGGRLVFSVFHPDMVESGLEANFTRDAVEYRLGAVGHSVDDYRRQVASAGFTGIERFEHRGDAALLEQVPTAGRYVGVRLLLILRAESR